MEQGVPFNWLRALEHRPLDALEYLTTAEHETAEGHAEAVPEQRWLRMKEGGATIESAIRKSGPSGLS